MRNFGSIHIFYQKAQSKLQIVHNFHSIHIFCQMAQSKSQIVHKHLKIRKMKQVVVSWTIEIQIDTMKSCQIHEKSVKNVFIYLKFSAFFLLFCQGFRVPIS